MQINDEENTVIHLDLFDSKQNELMEEFLFSFLITKFYRQNEDLFYLSKKVKIIIEISFGFINLIDKFKIYNLLFLFNFYTIFLKYLYIPCNLIQ